MATTAIGAARADAPLATRDEAAALLSRYPELSNDDLAALDHWCKRVASSLDLGLLASDPDLAPQYVAYRKAHLDRFSTRDIGLAALFVAITAGIFGILVLMVP
jgi:hypothetical protein